eukprot:364013-Chlamydomonas_euryale.AAC.3
MQLHAPARHSAGCDGKGTHRYQGCYGQGCMFGYDSCLTGHSTQRWTHAAQSRAVLLCSGNFRQWCHALLASLLLPSLRNSRATHARAGGTTGTNALEAR